MPTNVTQKESVGSSPPDRDASLQRLIDEYRAPHDLYDRLRARGRIVFDVEAGCWVVTGLELVRHLLSDDRFVSDVALANPRPRGTGRRPFASDAIQKQIIFVDGAKQARVHRAVLREVARRAHDLTAPLEECAGRLAERARARKEFDLVGDFATPFAMEAISLILGVPLGNPDEVAMLERWSTSFANITSGYLHARMEDIAQLGEHFRVHVAARGETPSDDLIGAFLRDGELDDEDDVVIQCMMAFSAGRVTTQKLLADGIPLLMSEWDRWRDSVRQGPSAIRLLVEELLRLVTPTRYVVRYATESVRLEDAGSLAQVQVQRGERMVLVLEAANRDAEAFAAPHALEARRRPNPHVTFGFGRHRCPGASMARIEIEIAIQTLLTTLQTLEPHPSAAPVWDPNPNIGGYASFPCICG